MMKLYDCKLVERSSKDKQTVESCRTKVSGQEVCVYSYCGASEKPTKSMHPLQNKACKDKLEEA